MSQAGEIDILGTHPEIPTEFVADVGTAVPILNTIEILGDVVAAGTTPVYTSASGNTLITNVQISQAVAATDATKIGLCNFNSASFSVDANGFVSLLGGGTAIDSIHPDSGTDPVVPTAGGLVNIVGSGSTTTVGSLNTLTLQLTGLTNHAILVGAGTATITKVGPSATAGQIFQSAGAVADPVFSTATYPSIATGTGTLLRADGTNWVATTSTYPNTNAVNTLLYASSANVMAALATANSSMLVTDSSGVPSISSSLVGDFTYTSNTAGTVRTLTVTNTDNTNSSSGALVKAVSGGASAGDAVFQASTTTTVWSFGVDNSVTSPTADPFVISQGTALGTNNIMSVATSGEINYPLQPAFLAYLASTALNKTGNGANYQLGTDALTEVFDQNSDFNTNGTFTAPVTGRYQLSCGAELIGNLVLQIIQLQVITSNRSYAYQVGRPAGATDIGTHMSLLVDMDAADTATVTITGFGEAGNTSDVSGVTSFQTYFSGYLAC